MPPNTDGQWTAATAFPVPNPTVNDGAGHSFVDTRGLFVLHAILLHTGKVLCFCGHVELSMYAPLCYLFDPKSPATLLAPIAFPPGADLFCCHYVQIPDGRVLAAGGSELHGLSGADFSTHGSTGSKTIALFDPVAQRWDVSKTGAVTNELLQGRWYPTLVSLPDGRVAAFSGRREFGSGVSYPPIADMVEVLAPPDWSTRELTGATKALPIYPGLHLAPNGRIYFTHTTWGQEMPNPDTASLLIPNGANSASWTNYAGVKPPHPRREEGMSVLLPPAQDGRILVIGGGHAVDIAGKGVLDRTGRGPHDPIGPSIFHHIEDTVDPLAADILDTSVEPLTPASWSSVGPMGFGRINGHCVLLPDATVLICGGHNRYKWEKQPATVPSLTAEIYTPGSGFRAVAAMHEPRMYHSIALLLSDGRVLVAGGADPNRSEPTLAYPPGWVGRTYPPMALNSKTFEFYEPPYMHKGPRPTITDVLRNGASTRRIEYGKTFKVTTPQATSIDKVALMRPACCTHHTDTEQRYVRLTFAKAAGELTVTAVADAKLAPPGYYMLWIIDSAGLPCQEAVFVQLVPAVGQPGGGKTCVVATAALGSPDHPSVVYLQDLRRELRDGSRAGRWFIGAVNRVYGWFSPRLARAIAADAPARAAVRELVVQPVVGVIERTDRLSRRIAPRRGRHALLMTLLTVEAAFAVAALPVLAATVLGRVVFARRRQQPDIASKE
jgi:hypothetical protein